MLVRRDERGRRTAAGWLGLLVTGAFLPACRDSSAPPAAPTPSATTTATTPADADPAPPIIRVLLADEIDRFAVSTDGPWTLRDGEGRALEAGETPLAALTIEPVAAPERQRAFRLRNPERLHRVDTIDIEPAAGACFTLRLPETSEAYSYRGTLRCVRRESGRVALVNDVGIEDYLAGVVGAEMPDSFEPHALRAQAIAARTYALYQHATVGQGRAWDVYAGPSSQVYRGRSGEAATPNAVEAVRATRGVVCAWNTPDGPKIFCTYYSSTCGGHTQSAAALQDEPLAEPQRHGVPCEACADSRYYRWPAQHLSLEAIHKALAQRIPPVATMAPLARIEIADETPEGRPTYIRLVDRAGRTETLRAEEFRLGVDRTGMTLRSTWFRIAIRGDTVTFYDGRGFGHGVGLCQWGANGLARRGASAEQILAYYYPTSELVLAYR